MTTKKSQLQGGKIMSLFYPYRELQIDCELEIEFANNNNQIIYPYVILKPGTIVLEVSISKNKKMIIWECQHEDGYIELNKILDIEKDLSIPRNKPKDENIINYICNTRLEPTIPYKSINKYYSKTILDNLLEEKTENPQSNKRLYEKDTLLDHYCYDA